MTEEELTAIENRATAATPGPWATHDQGREDYSICRDNGNNTCCPLFERIGPDDGGIDGAFISAARVDVPALIAEVRRLRAEVAMAYGHDYAKANPTYTGPCPLCHREDIADEVIRLREQLAAIDTLHKQWVIKFINGYERSKGVERLVDAIGKILHPQEREA